MMRKKIVSLCMALVLCLSLLPVTALAADGGTVYVGGEMLSGSTDSPPMPRRMIMEPSQ